MAENQDESKVYQELIGFLKADREDLRIAATEAVLAVKDREGVAKLIKHGIVSPLTKLSSHPDPVGVNALKTLVYLSSFGPSAPQCVTDLMDAGAMGRMTEICLAKQHDDESSSSWNKRINHAMALLVNMTRTERGAVELVGKTLPDTAVSAGDDLDESKLPTTRPTLELLLARFLSRRYIHDEDIDYNAIFQDEDAALALESSSAHDPFQHFASVLMNSTQTLAGRRFVMRIQQKQQDDMSTSVLQAILEQLQSKNPIRRRGIAGTVKNCCLETDAAWWLLNQVKITKHILFQLAGPEELSVDEKRGMDPDLWLQGPDKVREPDYLTRLYLVEALLLLCASGRKSRESLRISRTYVILKLADMVEEQEDVSERINECVQFLRRDEQGMTEGSSDELVAKATGGTRLALPASSTASQVGSKGVDYDNVD